MTPSQRAVLETMAPSGGDPALPYGLFDAGFDEFWLEFRRSATPSFRFGVAAALWVAAWGSPLLIRRLPPLQRLSPDDRERALEALFSSRFYLLRQVGLILKAVASFGYGADRRVRSAIGYPRQFDDPTGAAAP